MKSVSIKHVLLLTLSLFLFACSGGGTNNGGGANNGESSPGGDNVVTFDNVVIMDNDYAKVELVNFYAKDTNWTTGKRNDKCVTLKVTNQSPYGISISFSDGYINGEGVRIGMHNGNVGPESGKSKNYSYWVEYDTTPNPTELESLDKLYDLEATFTVTRKDKDDNYTNDKNEITFTMRDAVDGNIQTGSGTEEQAVESFEIGETITTDTVEFTLTDYQFGKLLSLENGDDHYLPWNGNSGLSAGDGNVYLVFDFTVKNTSKTSISGSDICGMDTKNRGSLYVVDYNDGYEFDSGNYCALDLVFAGNYVYSPIMDPLTTKDFRGAIKCVEEVETNTSAPLKLRITLPDGDSTKQFEYILR